MTATHQVPNVGSGLVQVRFSLGVCMTCMSRREGPSRDM